MDKGFNDDELADIMSEIESLEKEFTEEVDSSEDKAEASAGEDFEDMDDFPGDDEVAAAVAEASGEAKKLTPDHRLTAVKNPDQFEEDSFDDVLDSKPILDEPAPVLKAPPSPVGHEEKEVLHQVTQMAVEDVVHVKERSNHSPDGQHYTKGSTAQTSMSFNVQGEMSLNLSFNISGKTVELSVNDSGLELELDGGMKFSIPLEYSQHGKKAA